MAQTQHIHRYQNVHLERRQPHSPGCWPVSRSRQAQRLQPRSKPAVKLRLLPMLKHQPEFSLGLRFSLSLSVYVDGLSSSTVSHLCGAVLEPRGDSLDKDDDEVLALPATF